MEPLVPSAHRLKPLKAKADEVVAKGQELQHKVHSVTCAALRELVRSMNSYYSNRIEGQSTLPLDIERAMRKDLSAEPDVAWRQRLAVAHIEAEQELEQGAPNSAAARSFAFLVRAHGALYGRLSAQDRTMPEGRVVEPGFVRTEEVAVGQHVAPAAASLQAMTRRLDEVYARETELGTGLVLTACFHHRSMWLHPFIDGNGRAVRLATHVALLPITQGLWSVNRGLARNRDEYYARLAEADSPRRGDLDGRGNLSEEALCRWVDFFLSVALDQVTFMGRMLRLEEVKSRIKALLTLWSAEDASIRVEATGALHYVFLTGEVSRGEFKQMTGLGDRTAQSALAALLKKGILTSTSPKAPVRFGFPLNALQILMPELYPEADWKRGQA